MNENTKEAIMFSIGATCCSVVIVALFMFAFKAYSLHVSAGEFTLVRECTSDRDNSIKEFMATCYLNKGTNNSCSAIAIETFCPQKYLRNPSYDTVSEYIKQNKF